jgi:hypothetical protein
MVGTLSHLSSRRASDDSVNKNMRVLLVIIGAGASYDSVTDLYRFSADDVENFRPPLAQELFQDRNAFGRVLDEFPQCASLVGQLRRNIASGSLLESELEAYQEQANEYSPLHRQLAAIRFYLQQILWICSERWQQLSNGVTNYAELFYRLDRWRHKNEERVCVVTFNYDVLLEFAVSGTLGISLDSVSSYVATDEWKFLKLHGSVNWGHPTPSPGGTSYSKPGRARQVLIEGAEQLEIPDEYILRTPDLHPQLDGILFPALALPVETKSVFECPSDHLLVLDDCLRETMKIVVIGWRGTERHFLEKLKLLPGMAPKVQVVGSDEPGIRETLTNLASAGLAADRMQGVEGGFSAYVASDELEDFVGSGA